MSSIQGLQGATAVAFVPPQAPAVAPQAARAEPVETVRAERIESISGTQEAGERQASQGGDQALGSRFSAMA